MNQEEWNKKDAAEREYFNAIEPVKEEMRQLKADLDTLRAENARLKAEVAELNLKVGVAGVMCDGLEQQLTTARTALSAYDQAADKFTAKVESGCARSVETYNELVACREKSRACGFEG